MNVVQHLPDRQGLPVAQGLLSALDPTSQTLLPKLPGLLVLPILLRPPGLSRLPRLPGLPSLFLIISKSFSILFLVFS